MYKKPLVDLSTLLQVKKNNPPQRQALGRGIGALIKEMNTDNLDHLTQYVKKIPLNECTASPYQMRTNFNQEELSNLAHSIKTYGVLQPILVTPQGDNYVIIAGERRVRASKLAGLSEIPALIISVDKQTMLEIGIIENLQRADLNPLEEAKAFEHLIKEFNYTHAELANLFGKSRSYITNYLQILTLPANVQQMLIDKKISTSHARMLAGMANPEEFAQRIATEGLSVVDAYAHKQASNNTTSSATSKQRKANTGTELNPQLLYWIDNANVNSNLCKVNIKTSNANSGTVTISYKSLPELFKLLKI